MSSPKTYQERTFLRQATVSAAICALLCVALQADLVHAFDGKRKGFVLGGGIGPAYATVDNSNLYRGDSETFSVQTVFIIGSGVSDQVTISYTGLQFWGNTGYQEVGFALLPSAGLKYFVSPDAPSYFVSTGIGLAVYDNDIGEWSLGAGFSPHIGIGYEFAAHFSVEVDAVYTFGVDGEHHDLFNILFLVTGLAY